MGVKVGREGGVDREEGGGGGVDWEEGEVDDRGVGGTKEEEGVEG